MIEMETQALGHRRKSSAGATSIVHTNLTDTRIWALGGQNFAHVVFLAGVIICFRGVDIEHEVGSQLHQETLYLLICLIWAFFVLILLVLLFSAHVAFFYLLLFPGPFTHCSTKNLYSGYSTVLVLM
jgi:Ca2+/Na+ antiporter